MKDNNGLFIREVLGNKKHVYVEGHDKYVIRLTEEELKESQTAFYMNIREAKETGESFFKNHIFMVIIDDKVSIHRALTKKGHDAGYAVSYHNVDVTCKDGDSYILVISEPI